MNPLISLLESTTTALLAVIAPAVTLFNVFNSADVELMDTPPFWRVVAFTVAPVMVPVLVIPLFPLLIDPKPLVIEPASNAPVVVKLERVSIAASIVASVVASKASIFDNVIVPALSDNIAVLLTLNDFDAARFTPSLATIGPENVVFVPLVPTAVNPVIVVILFWVAVDIVADTGWLNVTTPLAAIAIASASLVEPIWPPSAIVIPPLWTERAVNVATPVTANVPPMLVAPFPTVNDFPAAIVTLSFNAVVPVTVNASLETIGPENVVFIPLVPTAVNPVMVVILFWVAVFTVPVKLPSILATNVPVVILKFPVFEPVAFVVPTVNLSALSSQPIKALALPPLSIIKPASLVAFVVPFDNSIKLSFTTVFVVLIVVVEPFTVISPVTTKLPPI